MVTDKIKQLEATKAKLARLEKSVAAQLHKELARLPEAYGFESLDTFIKTLKAVVAGKPGPRPRPPGRKRRRRAVITDATRASVKKLAAAGKTGAQIAREVGISLPSVQNIKKSLGLVKARK